MIILLYGSRKVLCPTRLLSHRAGDHLWFRFVVRRHTEHVLDIATRHFSKPTLPEHRLVDHTVSHAEDHLRIRLVLLLILLQERLHDGSSRPQEGSHLYHAHIVDDLHRDVAQQLLKLAHQLVRHLLSQVRVAVLVVVANHVVVVVQRASVRLEHVVLTQRHDLLAVGQRLLAILRRRRPLERARLHVTEPHQTHVAHL